MDDEVWVGLLDTRPGPGETGGAYAYCAGRGDDLATAIAAICAEAGERDLEILSIEWLSRYVDLPESRQHSEGVAGVLLALADGEAAFDYFFTYPEEDEPDPAGDLKKRVEAFVGGWIEGAVENELELGWAYNGLLEDAPGLFARAAEAAASEEDD